MATSGDGKKKSKERSSNSLTSMDDEMKHKKPSSSSFVKTVNNNLVLIRNSSTLFLYNTDTVATEGTLMCIPKYVELTVRGKLQFNSIGGKVRINGCPVASNTFMPLYSPTSHSLSTLEVVSSEIKTLQDLKDRLSKYPLLTSMFASVQPCDIDAVVSFLTQPDNSPEHKKGWGLLIGQKLDSIVWDLLKESSSYSKLFDYFPGDPIGELLGFSLIDPSKSGHIPTFKVTDEMRNSKKLIDTSCENNDKPLKLLVSGFKNCGKSSLVRYLTNYILSTPMGQSGVVILDCDVGQPEFTIAGFVSLTHVTRPLLGPPFTNHMAPKNEPLRQCFTGSLTPADNPQHYSESLQFVFDAYLSMDPKPPLIVNTMGWVRGLGLLFLADQMKMVQPNCVIQLEMPKANLNSPRITQEFLQETSGFIHKDMSEEIFNHKLLVLSSPAVTQTILGAPGHRDLTILTHILSSLHTTPACLPSAFLPSNPPPNPATFLQARKPYCVLYKDSRLALHIFNPDVTPFPRDQLTAAFNASLVVMCHQPEENLDKSDDPLHPTTLKNLPVCQSIGVGIVRSIDPVKGIIYFLSGLDLETISGVNCLLKGAVDLPQSILQDQLHIEDAPYVEDPVNCGVGRLSIKTSRPHLKVRRNPNVGKSH